MRDSVRPRGDVYDWWSRHPRALDLLYAFSFLGREAAFRDRAESALELASGERVLEIGCGTGNSFETLAAGVGPTGMVVGLDASPGMVRRTRQRIQDLDASNVHVVQGDATRLPVPSGSVDAVYTAMSLSAVPDPAAAITALHRVLRPGGRLSILDARPLQAWPWRLANQVVVPVSRRLTNWVTDADIPSLVREEFAEVAVDTFTGGAIYIVTARKEGGD